MSLDKAIEHNKEYRKPYKGSKAIDCSCRNHGSCDWCKHNRMFKFRDKHPRTFEDYDMSDAEFKDNVEYMLACIKDGYLDLTDSDPSGDDTKCLNIVRDLLKEKIEWIR